MNNYKKAYTEVLEILSYFPSEEYAKIPKEKIEFYKRNKDNNYIYKINPDIDLSEQSISKEANAILVKLYRDYYANEKQKDILNNLLKENQEKTEQEKRERYNPDDIFKETKNNVLTENNLEKEEVRNY